jgi:hypothetical protein
VRLHPKDVLYARVYDPITQVWFAQLARSPRLNPIIAGVPSAGLTRSLLAFNQLMHDTVDSCLIEGTPGLDVADMISAVREHFTDVSWVVDAPTTRDDEALRDGLAAKLKRNVSLGVIEALICLESALAYCDHALPGLDRNALAATLVRSRQLYGSLALLHDDQEMVRLTFLTGRPGYLMYPEVGYEDVLTRRVTIPAEKFVSSGTQEAPRLRFVTPPPETTTLTSPIKRCPAHRFRSEEKPELMLNDWLWDLLVELYANSGRLG